MRRLPFPRRFSLGVLVAVLLLGVGGSVYFYWDFTFEDREITVATASPFFRFEETKVPLKPRATACIDTIALSPRSDAARIAIHTRDRKPVPFELITRGEGYSEKTVVRNYRGDGKPFGVLVTPPKRELLGQACIRNVGDTTFRLSASNEARTASRSMTRIDGRSIGPRVSMHLVERDASTLASNMNDFVTRIAAFMPPYFGRTFIWALLWLTLTAIPLGIALAFAWSVGRDRTQDDPST